MNETKKLSFDPMLLLFLGATPALGATADVRGVLTMGCTVTVVMLLSALVMLALKKLLPEGAKVPAALLVTAGFASLARMFLQAYLPAMAAMLGLYAAVAAVDLLVFSQAERPSVKTALLSGLGFIVLLFVTSALRELFGAGSFAGLEIPFLKEHSISLLLSAPGGLVIYAIVAAVVNKLFPARLSLEGFTGAAAANAGEGE